jgi:hypothetical protein
MAAGPLADATREVARRDRVLPKASCGSDARAQSAPPRPLIPGAWLDSSLQHVREQLVDVGADGGGHERGSRVRYLWLWSVEWAESAVSMVAVQLPRSFSASSEREPGSAA